MAVELEKLAQHLKEKGYFKGSEIVSSFTEALHGSGLIPESLDEPLRDREEGDLPPFVFDKQPRYLRQIDALGLSLRTRNVLVRAGRAIIRELDETSDADILAVRRMGKLGLAELRRSLADFREKVISERQRLGIEDDTPVRLRFPTE